MIKITVRPAAALWETVVQDDYAARISSNFRDIGPVTDFEPWAGTISFDSETDWHFGPGAPAVSQSDFVTVAAHEIGHILGIGTAAAFDRWVVNDVFTGPNATAVNGGQGIPVEADHAHVVDGFAGNDVLMDPILIQGDQVTVSEFDKAILADIGYEIVGFTKQGSTPPIATAGAERIFGTDVADVINALGGNDTVQGADGNDEIRGGSGDDVFFGQGGTDTFVISAGDGQNTISDFDLGSETIRLIDSGFGSASEAAAAVTKVASNVSRLTLNDGTTVDVFHNSQTGTPLNASHFEMELNSSAPPILPGPTPNSSPSGSVEIIGVAAVGNTLVADTSSVNDSNGIGTFDFAWLRDGEVITNANEASYILTDDDAGTEIQVQVSYTDGLGNAETLRSPATNAVSGEDERDDTVSPTTSPTTLANNGDEGDMTNPIEGTPGDDMLTGEDSDDIITGGAGNDTLTGGVGFDTFVINPGDGRTEITDFDYFLDTIDLSGFDRIDVALSILNVEGTDEAVLRFADGTELIV